MNATKFILFSLVFLCTAISQAITGHTYVLTGVYRPDSTSCDPAQLAVNRHYQASLGQEKPFFFMLDTVCFHMENGIYLEIQMLIEPRVKEEIPAVEKYVEELGYSKIAGMILQLQPLKQIIAHGRFQWIFEKGEEQDLKAEHEVAQIFYSYLEMQAERAKLTEAFQEPTWEVFYSYLTPLIGEHLISMTRYYSARRSNRIAGIVNNYFVRADDVTTTEMAVPNVYRACGDFTDDGKCR